MLVETDRMIPIARLQNELVQTLQRVHDENESIYILKNNTMEAVMVPFRQYEYLSALEEVFERMEIAQQVHQRLKDYNSSNNADWEAIKDC